MKRSARFYFLPLLATALLFSCAPKPPDAPVFEKLTQRIDKDPVTGHTLLTPSPACMKTLGEAECGHAVWIVTGQERYIGEAHKMIPLQLLVDTGKKDAKGNAVIDWQVQVDQAGKPIMVSSWLGDKKPWSQVQAESLLLPAEESYAPLSSYIIDACEKMHCSDQVTRFKVKLDSLNGISGAISGPPSP